ncbi:MAG: DUF2868 domain-containing protein [Chromatiaceae bacterium]|nr:MAG: DUF2868 domain-containing protein [Chromatiaceae bacterium]
MAPLLRRTDPDIGDALSPRQGWTVPDLIDFDYFVDEDEHVLRANPAERKRFADRDRRLYLQRIAPLLPGLEEHKPQHRRRALRLWLQLRRRAEDPALAPILPGSAFARGQRLVAAGLGLLGLFAGIGLASALLQYNGVRPVNVSWYLFWLVLIQIMLAGATVAAWYGRRSAAVKATMHDVSLLAHLLKPLFVAASRWVQRARLANAPIEVRDRAQARQGLVRAQFSLYGPAAYLPMLFPAQVFGIGFNLGAILCTVALAWFTDLAFGWGSALNVHPQAIYGLTRLVALPWSWLFGDGVGFPTLEQVAGTRISLKDPLALYDAGNLRSWRWFIVLAVFTYGLLPRLILLGLSVLTQYRALAALPFTHQRAQALYARLLTPTLEEVTATSGHGPDMPIPAPLTPLRGPRSAPRGMPPASITDQAPAAAPATEERPASATKTAASVTAPASPPAAHRTPEHTPATMPQQRPDAVPAKTTGTAPTAADRPAEPAVATAAAPTPQPAQPEPTPEPTPGPAAERVAADACLLLIHLDVMDVLEPADHSRLQRMLLRHAGWRIAASATYGGGSAMTKQALELIENADWQAPPARVALIQDGSQPPITENLRFLRQVRAAAGDTAQVLLALVGDPTDDDRLPPADAFDYTDWQRKIDQLGDPYLRLEMLATADEEV